MTTETQASGIGRLPAELGASEAEHRDGEYLLKIHSLEAELQRSQADTARLDWLERHDVNVREPLVYGSRDMFWASPDRSFEGEEGPSGIRAKIDAALQPKDPTNAQ